METGLKHFHSYWAYLVLLTLLIAVVNAIIGLAGNKTFTSRDRFLALFALIAAHTQLLIGLVLYFVSPLGARNLSNMGEAMKNPGLRLYVVEHPLVNIIAIVLITIGYSRAKRLPTDNSKFKTLTIMYLIALVLLLSRIPWNAWRS
ncbi:hypothetical protein GXP67_17490 [Rhodocytophaga rosea]|uniref:50S ribosomal protein L27 n=1 Tax=Rhodocytophaga rosea TaxID=2704465 RepID=A0A6C0GJZ2_9BACT|nr:hypothetical protein [Rhodocytophaga rosea]QHT68305.1 hypothetical protein GXP67_17490 [Rhodocytophaga rosea]